MAQHSAEPEGNSSRRRFILGWSTRSKIISGVLGATLVGVSAYAATNWVVSLGSGSHGQAQSATVSNITISAVASPSPSNLLFPGGNGDVVAQITNPNSFPVTLTAVNLPTNTTYAAGFSDSGLSAAQSGCDSTTSVVSWRFATGSSGSSHTLTTAITVDANSSVAVTFTNDATMGLSAPAACENTYFQMPSLTGVTATGGAATPSSGPLTDGWTS
jgi:hypothetical protein